jgi:hypothetical protein
MIHHLQSTHEAKNQKTRAATPAPGEVSVSESYRTSRGVMYHGSAETALSSPIFAEHEGKVQLRGGMGTVLFSKTEHSE